ncbi:hypothetical protein SAY87_004526 [Trapa incisa]|uniref:Formin-like protein n=1 Tax=Trapa incisa TaxID=236973 RepID=A0AAN7JP21_9MYRT|nr:hypothetical protein SAY87_004526 [Trapa incisa]
MSIPLFTFLLFHYFTSTLCPLAGATATATVLHHYRRFLHQPFFPLDSLPSSQPPSPSPPSPPLSPTYPFTSSSSSSHPPTSDGFPFFPTYPSPPPPPSPTSINSFPANISSLNLPHPPSPTSSSRKLIYVATAAAISALLSSVAFFLCLHRRRSSHGLPEDTDNAAKTGSSPESGVGRSNTETGRSGWKRSNAPSVTSSEFLYLGTIVNSRGVENRRNAGRGGGNAAALDPRKLESPELQPLPPLARQGFMQNDNGGSTAGETEEEFYSPRGSLGTLSVSRRVFAAVVGLEDSRRISDSSQYSSSSSTSSSLARSSHSVSLSPPVSLSPHRSLPKSPEVPFAELSKAHAVLFYSHSSSPERDVSPDRNPHPYSPSLSPLSWSPERGLERNPDASLRMWNISDSNVQSLLSSYSAPGRASMKSSPSSLLSQSPERAVLAATEVSPRTSSASEQSQRERFSLLASHSPSLSPESVTAAEVGQHQEPVILAPPHPPPPPPLLHKFQDSPTDRPVLRPPPLTPFWKPFELQKMAVASLVDLPPSSGTAEKVIDEISNPKKRLKPLHWDKEMVWDHLGSSSFKLNEEMIETLFLANAPSLKPKDMTPQSVLSNPSRVLDPKKSRNIAILLKALNVTVEEVVDALLEGNLEMLGSELLESLQKMAPTKEEELKLKDLRDDSPIKLGHAERFLKAMLDVPFAFKRVDAMLFIANFESEVDYLKKSFETLEVACEELRNSRMFLKLLEAVLKTGNRMNVGTNRGDAHAFKLDTLIKLVDVKDADGKTTLLHFVVQEIIRSEGARLSRMIRQTLSNPNQSDEDVKCRKLGLQVVSGLTSELANVKRAAAMDSGVLNGDVNRLSLGIRNFGEMVQMVESSTGRDGSSVKFSNSLKQFIKLAEEEILRIQAQESRSMSLGKEITEYFHGDSAKEESHPFRIFTVVKDFLAVLDRVCKEVWPVNERTTVISSAHRPPNPVNQMEPPVLLTFQEKKRNDSWDDEESLSL